VVGAGSGGRGGFDLFVSFSGEGVLEDLELTTSSLITLVAVGFTEFFLKESDYDLDMVKTQIK